jgi:hypothetical protein
VASARHTIPTNRTARLGNERKISSDALVRRFMELGSLELYRSAFEASLFAAD